MTSPTSADLETNASRVILALSFAAYLWIFLPLIAASGRSMGHDYALFLPNLLAGYYWFLGNGPLATPWFSPAQCGGIPFFADPNVGYFSFPQWAAFAVSPIATARATLAVFAALGALGFYLLLRARFGIAPAAAAAASVLFLFSGFFTYRMAIGHLTFHPYALTPWLAWSVLAPRRVAPDRAESIFLAALPPAVGGLLIGYMFQAGMIHVLPCVLIATAVVLLVHGELRGHQRRAWVFLTVAALLGCALSASRLSAIMAFLGNFPRDQYSLPGFPDPLVLLGTVTAALFWHVPVTETIGRMENVTWTPTHHEWEYGVGPIALALLVAGTAVAVARFRRERPPFAPIARSLPAWGAIAIALTLPLALNWYEPTWNRLLKSLPYFESSSILVRWFALYIPIVVLLSGLALNRIAPDTRGRIAGAVLVSAVTIVWNAAADKTYYQSQPYNGSRVDAAWHAARSSGHPPAITHITLRQDQSGEVLLSGDGNDMLTLGYSHLYCYQPIFGYQLEKLPIGSLHPGPVLEPAGPGVLNVKNPACYLFPRENDCAPGDHFRFDQHDDVERFLRYEPYVFARSLRQIVWDAVSRAALLMAGFVILGNLPYALRRAASRPRRGTGAGPG